MNRRITTEYRVKSERLTRAVTFAVVSDLHNGSFDDVVPQLAKCDAILVPGDLIDRHHPAIDNALAFLAQAPQLAPVFYSLGNHERKHRDAAQWAGLVAKSGVTVLDDRVVTFGEVALGGLTSAKRPTDRVVAELEAADGFRLLLCHHPEYFPRFLAGRDIDLTVAGHAHGGQMQLFGRGLYAPGQGLLPRYTQGFYEDGRLLVSRGMTNSAFLPRWNDPCELVLLHLDPAAS